SSRSSTRVKMNTVSPSAKEIFSSRWKMISPYCSHSSCERSVVNPSSRRRLMSRWTGSLPAGDSRGSSAFSRIFVGVLVHEADEGGLPVRDDLAIAPVALQHQRDEARDLRVVFHDENHVEPLLEPDTNAFSEIAEDRAGRTAGGVPQRVIPPRHARRQPVLPC